MSTVEISTAGTSMRASSIHHPLHSAMRQSESPI
jgi:hypothetical protein